MQSSLLCPAGLPKCSGPHCPASPARSLQSQGCEAEDVSSEEASGGLQLEWELAMAAAWGGAASDDSEEPEEWGISGKQSNIALQQGGFDNKQDRLGEI